VNKDDTVSIDLTLHLKSLCEQGWHIIYRPHITLEFSLWTGMTHYLQTSHYTWSLSLNKDDTVSTDLTLHLNSLFEQGWHSIYRPHITLEVSLWTGMTQYLETYNMLESSLNKDDTISTDLTLHLKSLFEQLWHSIYRPHITLEVSLWTRMIQYLQTSHYTWSLSLNKDDTISTDLTLHLKSLWTGMTQYLQTSHYTWSLSLNKDDTVSRPHITLEVSLWTGMTQYLQTSHYTWSLSVNRDDTVSIDLTLHLKSLCEQGWHSIYRPHITLEVSLWTGMTQYL
jgi:hypothetical protein